MRFDVVLALLVSDEQGNAKAFLSWNEQQDWLHVFIYINQLLLY